MSKTLQERLSGGEILITDGAKGTMFMAAGLPAGTPPELWNVEQPEQVLKLHRAYVGAGSQIIGTNTIGANRIKLDTAGYGERVRELNLAAAALAREAAGPDVYVVGDIGPTGEMMAPLGPLTYDAAQETFADQAEFLAEGGVDAIWVETMMDLEEARAAVTAARRATGLPILCSMSFGKRGRTMMGVSAGQAAKELWPLGLVAIGANCGEGIGVVSEVLLQMAEVAPDAPLIAQPNAGLPRLEDGETVYETDPANFAAHMVEFIALGARVVGACCGSNPAYIEALAAVVRQI